ncbi:MAG: hypothetical protein ABIY55_17820, partial [Kofleriaceae bacterium]
GHTPSVCRASYIHPAVIDDFGANKLAVLARQLKRRAAHPETPVSSIAVETLRAIEPVVARYLDPTRRRKRA